MLERMMYKVNLDLSGRLTQLADSQKLFGALVSLYGEYTSPEKASEFVRAVREDSLFFSLSNLLPLGYFPAPQGELLERLAHKNGQGSKDKEQYESEKKEQYKAVKKRRYIKLRELSKLCENQEQAKDIFPYVKTVPSQQVRLPFLPDDAPYKIARTGPALYSVPEITAIEIRGKEEEQDERKAKPARVYNFYFSVDAGEAGAKFLQALEWARRAKRPLFLGPRASQGLNLFTIKEIINESHLANINTACYLNLGMLLPRQIDFPKSTLKLFTSERRPYAKGNVWTDGNDRQFISFIASGSVIYPADGLERAGRSIASPFDKERAAVFGNAFLYPLKELREEGTK